ncbi:Small subunit (SSU) processome component [Tulasnella sp. 331]|nr:Small subunit (SSU) processome component [Tulasnella sp. 331]
MENLLHTGYVLEAAKKSDTVPFPRRHKGGFHSFATDSQGRSRGRKEAPSKSQENATALDEMIASLTPNLALPRRIRELELQQGSLSEGVFKVNKNDTLTPFAYQRRLQNQSVWMQEAKAAVRDAEILNTDEPGRMIADAPLERTWRVAQDEICQSVGQEQARYRKEWKLDGGPYRSRYSRNGRHLAIAGKKGHIAAFDWQVGKLHYELQLGETCRDISFLNDHAHIAVAQKQHVYIYDQQGIELHRLTAHNDITHLEYLPYHWLLTSVVSLHLELNEPPPQLTLWGKGNPGILRYHDTSTGQIVASHRTKLGACHAMAQNTHNAVIHLGHQNGTVTLWTPNMSTPAVKLLAHLGGVTSVSIDPSTSGRYMATAGNDGKVRVWDCRNWKGTVRDWTVRGTGASQIEWSQKGYLTVASGGAVNVYTPRTVITEHPAPPPLYLTHAIPNRPLVSARFCPFTDVLTIGHAGGLSSIIVPGAGEATFDSSEANPFESKHTRREREVRNLLDKIQPDLISLDPDFVGTIAPLEASDEFGEKAEDVPYYKLPRQEKLRRAGVHDAPWSGTGADTKQAEELELGYSASDSEESEYEGEDSMLDGSGHGVKTKMKRSALKAYQKKSGKNVKDPTSAKIRARMAVRKRELQRARAAKEGPTALIGSQFPNSIDVRELDFGNEDESEGWEEVFQEFLSTEPIVEPSDDAPSTTIPIGLSLLHTLITMKDKRNSLAIRYIAFSTSKRVLLVKAPTSGLARIPRDQRREALARFLSGDSLDGYILVALELGSIALSIYGESRLPVKAVDLSGPFGHNPGDLPSSVIGSNKVLGPWLNEKPFKEIWRRPFPAGENEADEEFKETERTRIALRAWLTGAAARTRAPLAEKVTAIDMRPTDSLTSEHLDILAKIQMQFDLLEAIKPEKAYSEFSAIAKRETGQVSVKQAMFKNKLRKGTAQDIRFLDGDTLRFEGRVSKASGKDVTVMTSDTIDGAFDEETGEVKVDAIEVIGRDDLTGADKARVSLVLRILERTKTNPLLDVKLIRKIWCPNEEDTEDMKAVSSKLKQVQDEELADSIGGVALNSSQAKVAGAMLSSDPRDDFALVHGPPGTGKTRSISAVVRARVEAGKMTYLVAQSNVGVKNIAETLARGEFTNFKLLRRHEHIYEPCREQIITSDAYRSTDFKDTFGSVMVILSTVDMLFHPMLEKKGLFRMIPVQYLVEIFQYQVDEASQIYSGSYLALFDKFRATLNKVCWFGDPRQLPPHQREQISGLDSIYDIHHVKEAAMLLDTQYRMPVPIGQFISKHVYQDELQSKHSITSLESLKFVDVAIGNEKTQKTSWVNDEEVKTIVQAVKRYYSKLDFCVLTPYDAQRKALETALKKESLPDKCYNVDSFQDNRVNVMLTRCKKGMVIFAKKGFVRQDAAHSLVGILAQEWVRIRGGKGKEHLVWANFSEVMKGTADLPGVAGVREKVVLLPQKPKPVAPPSPAGFLVAPRTTNGAVNLFNGLTPNLSHPAANAWPAASTRRKGGMTFVSLRPAEPSIPITTPKPVGPTAPTAPWGIARPTILAQSATMPATGAWASGGPKPRSGPSPSSPTRPTVASPPRPNVQANVSHTTRIGAPLPTVNSGSSARPKTDGGQRNVSDYAWGK